MRSYAHNEGYRKLLLQDGRYVYEHRWVMEQHLGRELEAHEQVHHKNHNRADNRLGNLEIIDIRTHGRHHAQQYWEPRKAKNVPNKACHRCGTMYGYVSKNGLKQYEKSRFCSNRCAIANARLSSPNNERR